MKKTPIWQEDKIMNTNTMELNLKEMEMVNGAGLVDFIKEILEDLLDGMKNAD